MTDGTSNQFLFGENTGGWRDQDGDGVTEFKAYEWAWMGINAAPGGFGFSEVPRASTSKWKSDHAGIIQFALGDGSVRAISVNISVATFNNLTAMGDGNPAGEF